MRTVTGTLTDVNGIPLAAATLRATLRNSVGRTPTQLQQAALGFPAMEVETVTAGDGSFTLSLSETVDAPLFCFYRLDVEAAGMAATLHIPPGEGEIGYTACRISPPDTTGVCRYDARAGGYVWDAEFVRRVDRWLDGAKGVLSTEESAVLDWYYHCMDHAEITDDVMASLDIEMGERCG